MLLCVCVLWCRIPYRVYDFVHMETEHSYTNIARLLFSIRVAVAAVDIATPALGTITRGWVVSMNIKYVVLFSRVESQLVKPVKHALQAVQNDKAAVKRYNRKSSNVVMILCRGTEQHLEWDIVKQNSIWKHWYIAMLLSYQLANLNQFDIVNS